MTYPKLPRITFSNIIRRTARVLTSIALAYLALCGALYFLQERMIFMPEKLPADFRFSFPGTFEEHVIPVDGARLSALWFRAPNAKGTVFYLHGNAASLRDWGDVAPDFTSRGYDAFILDYRGYGKSSGNIQSEAQLHADVEAAYAHLMQRAPARPIYIYGRSIGTGLAVELARRHTPQALLLESPYANLAARARAHYPWIPAFLLRYRLASDERLPHVRAPVHLFHGSDDTTIAPQSSHALAALAVDIKSLTIVAGADHNNVRHTKAYNSALDQALP